jgi:sarcosine oxidase subunit beta
MRWVSILFKIVRHKKIRTKNGKIEGVETSKGFIRANKIGVVASGHTSVLAETAGIRLPLQSKPLQALVSEPIKPIIDTVVMSAAVHAYVSQSDKGELVIGAGTDSYNSFTQRGGFNIIEETIRAMVELYPVFGKMKMLRQWGGIVDICPDASPIISKCDVEGLFFNCGWGTGVLKRHPGAQMYLLIPLQKMNPIKSTQPLV